MHKPNSKKKAFAHTCTKPTDYVKISRKLYAGQTIEEIFARSKAQHSTPIEAQKERLAAINELLCEYKRESDPDERANILRTLEEISANEPLEMPTMTVDSWANHLKASGAVFAKADQKAIKR